MGVEAGPSVSIVNEGPIRGSLEGFKPMNVSDISTIDKGGVVAPLGEIVFNQQPLTAEAAISEAEAILSEAKVGSNPIVPKVEPLSESSVVVEAKHWLGLVEPRIEPKLDDQPLPRIVPVPASEPAVRSESNLATQVFQQEVQNAIKEEEIIVEERKDEPSKIREEEEVEELKLKYVEHDEVSRQRKYQLGQAINKADAEAKEEGNEEIAGDTLKKYFAPEDRSNRSGIAQPGVSDGSLEETYRVLAARNYSSAGEAIEVVDTTVEQFKPVKKAKEGKKVKETDIARVRKDSLKRHPVEEVVARIVKKRILAEKSGQKPVEVNEVQVESLEGTIEDNPDLAEVFKPKIFPN